MQIGYANTVYAANDPADMALPVHQRQFSQCPGQPPGQICIEPLHVGAYEWGGKSGGGRDDFVTGTQGDRLNSRYGTLAGFGPATRPLNRIIYPTPFTDHLNPTFDAAGAQKDTLLDLDLMRCPSDTGYTGLHFPDFKTGGLSSYDHFGTSFTANIFWVANAGGGEIRSNSPYLHRMSEILSPATTLAYQENNGRFGWTAGPEPCDFLEGVVGTVRGWHGKDWTFNAAFIDGHVDTIYMRGYRNARVMQNDDVQSSFRCIIIRGEGWQKDTLPLPDLPTGLLFGGDDRPSYEGGIE